MIHRYAVTILAVVMIALALSACAGGAGVVTSASTISVEATEFAFTPNAFTAQVGEELTFEITNNGTLEHNFVVLDPSGNELARTSIAVAATESVKIVLVEGGTYTIVCDIEGHQVAGMEAALTVQGVATRREP
ncbi:MAG TPA: cupredoxin domain-containing protein [Anaerolineae bacterium]|nr:cupredoxin domain-containing protein [Anaerolineae bacterium]